MSAGQAKLQSLRFTTEEKRGPLRTYLSAHYGRVLFVAVFILPTLLAAIYFGLIASDRYISEARFIVRSADKPASQGAAAYLQDFGITRANDDAFAIADYIHSRDVMQAIEKQCELSELALDELKSFSALIEDDVFHALSLAATLATKSQTGGTAPERVGEALAEARKRLAAD